MHRNFYIEAVEGSIKFENTLPPPSGDGHAFTLIIDPIQIKELYIIQYQYRKIDGIAYQEDFSAEIYVEVLDGTYTDVEAFQLEDHLKDLNFQLEKGWWLSAQNTNTGLSLLGIYTQIMKDSIQLTIDNYVIANY